MPVGARRQEQGNRMNLTASMGLGIRAQAPAADTRPPRLEEAPRELQDQGDSTTSTGERRTPAQAAAIANRTGAPLWGIEAALRFAIWAGQLDHTPDSRETAEAIGVSRDVARNYLRAWARVTGAEFVRCRRTDYDRYRDTSRDEEIKRMRQAGMRYAEIGRQLGVSPQRVGQIMARIEGRKTARRET